jgi:hypothetical protein
MDGSVIQSILHAINQNTRAILLQVEASLVQAPASTRREILDKAKVIEKDIR